MLVNSTQNNRKTRHTHVVIFVTLLQCECYFSQGTQFSKLPVTELGVVTTHVSHDSLFHDIWMNSQQIHRAHPLRQQVEYCNGNQTSIQTVTLMPWPQPLLAWPFFWCVSFQSGTEEPFKVCILPSVGGLFMDGLLVFEEDFISGISNQYPCCLKNSKTMTCLLSLWDRIAFYGNLEFMRRLDWPLGLWVNGPFQIGVFGFVDRLHNVEFLFALLLFPEIGVSGTLEKYQWVDLLSTLWSEHCSFPDILLAQHILVPPVDGFPLISPWFVFRGFKPNKMLVNGYCKISSRPTSMYSADNMNVAGFVCNTTFRTCSQ